MTTFALMAALLAIVGCLVVGSSAGYAVRAFRPAQAVVLLASASFALSLACGVALTAIAVAVLATLTSVAAEGRWSATAIRAQVTLPGWLGAAAALAVSILLLRAVWRTVRICTALVRADRLSRTLRTGRSPVVIVDDDSADAYTVAGIRGCVVISQSLLRHLSADERRVVLAHELSHLTRRHHLYLHLADIAAAANPLLARVPRAIRSGVERWADEDACVGIGNRQSTGRALARVALLRSALTRSALTRASAGAPARGLRSAAPTRSVDSTMPARGPDPAVSTLPDRRLRLGMAHHEVTMRVQALLQPVPPRRVSQVVLAIGLSLLILLVGLTSLDHIQDAIDTASSWYRPVSG